MNEVKYFIDEKNKTIVCQLCNCKHIAEYRVEKYATHLAPRFKELDISDKFYGIARCNPEDEFDIEYGKKISLTRAKRKRGQAINNMIKNLINKVQRELDTLEKYGIHEVPEVDV